MMKYIYATLSAALLLLFALGFFFRAADTAPTAETAAKHFSASPPVQVFSEKAVTETESIVPQEQHYYSPELAAGEEQLLRPGTAGLSEKEIVITYANGKEIGRSVLSERTVLEPIDAIILFGADRSAVVRTHPADPTAEDGILRTPEGETFSYSRVLSCSATAYSCESQVGTTATGTTARVGAVAVDPNYIPYGTKMYIVSDDGAYIYGYATAEDCGNFRGYHVDLYFDTVAECWAFGRRSCTVYILS